MRSERVRDSGSIFAELSRREERPLLLIARRLPFVAQILSTVQYAVQGASARSHWPHRHRQSSMQRVRDTNLRAVSVTMIELICLG